MGLPSIKQKLQAQFDVGINSEAEVVYALVETRKLLEITGCADAYPSLAFHCDWVLHTRMDRRGARRVLKLFDDLAEKQISGLESSSEYDAIGKLLDISKFRSEFEAFLDSEHVSTNFDLHKWFRFARLYSLVIEDVPLLVGAAPRPQLVQTAIHIRHLKSVVVTARKDEEISYLDWVLNYREDPPPVLSPAGFSIGFGIKPTEIK